MLAAVLTADTSAADVLVRIAARAVDVLILAALDYGLGLRMGFGYDWLLAGTAMVLGYFVLFDAVVGATPGKLLCRLRVLGPSGGRPSPREALLREAFTVVGSVPFVGPFLALAVWIWIVRSIRASPLRQGVHDRLAGGTQVVRV